MNVLSCMDSLFISSVRLPSYLFAIFPFYHNMRSEGDGEKTTRHQQHGTLSRQQQQQPHHEFTFSKSPCRSKKKEVNTPILEVTKMAGKIVLDSALKAAVNVGSSKLPKEVAKSSSALLSSLTANKITLPDLPYDYNALEPAISAETMTLHHSKHHNTYVTNLNATVEKIDSAMNSGDVSATIALQGALKFNGGGHINHCLFWENLSPNSSGLKSGGALETAINERFGSLDAMKTEMSATTVAVQGSGWGWLGYNPKSGSIEIATCPNQDPLEATTGLKPLLGIDVWEHAYYVDYRNVRPDYVKAVWDIINWDVVEARLEAAK